MERRKIQIKWTTSDGALWDYEAMAAKHQDKLNVKARDEALRMFLVKRGFADPTHLTNSIVPHWSDLCALVREFGLNEPDDAEEQPEKESCGAIAGLAAPNWKSKPAGWFVREAPFSRGVGTHIRVMNRDDAGRVWSVASVVASAGTEKKRRYAALIAAAPDMLAALETTLCYQMAETHRRRIVDAIAKAKGEAP